MSRPQEEGYYYVCDCGPDPEAHCWSEDWEHCRGVFVWAKSACNAVHRAKRSKTARGWEYPPYVHPQDRNITFKRYCLARHRKAIGKLLEPQRIGRETVEQARFLRDMGWHDGNEQGPCDACGLWTWDKLPESEYCGNCQLCRECKDEPCEECDE